MNEKEWKEVALAAIARGDLIPPAKVKQAQSEDAMYRKALEQRKIQKVYAEMRAKWEAENDSRATGSR